MPSAIMALWRRPLKPILTKPPAPLRKSKSAGVSLAKVYAELEAEGVKAFETSYLDLLKALADKAGALAGGT